MYFLLFHHSSTFHNYCLHLKTRLLKKNYHRLVYLAQTEDSELREKAEIAADQLELQFEYRFTGYGTLETVMNTWQQSKSYGKADQHLLA